ncbi:MAG: tRNA-dihydrouridine synthase [bacterium]|nr:tRNA-dihydrouridine synthase [bacterium]
MKSFWDNLPKPFFAMAPMKDVTDAAFRALIAKRGAPDVFWTEFVSADGLYHTREIKKMKDEENPLMRDLQFREDQRPIVAQIFSNKPEMIAYATRLVAELGFDGVDLNMGCPDRTIEKQGAGAAMIKNPELAVEIIHAAKEASSLPVSVKTRIGYNKESLDEWLPVLLRAGPAAITLHLRTRKEMSLVPADWELMKKAVEIRNKINPSVLLIGNGDVQNLEDARARVSESGCDGVMLGRAMFGNPWVFEGISGHRMSSSEVGHPMSTHGLDEKLEALVELAYSFEKISPPKNFSILKKHIKAFVTGFPGAAELRAKLMSANSAADLERAIKTKTA